MPRLRPWLTRARGTSLASVRERFIALDLETTGLDSRRDAIVSLAAIPFVGGVPSGGYVTLVDPARAIPPQSTAVHGITDASVRGAPRLAHVLREVEATVRDAVLVGHSVDFDVAVLTHASRQCGRSRLRNPALDTGRLAAALHPQWRDFSLEHVAERLGVEVVARHTAEGDALTAGRIFVTLLPELEAFGLLTLSHLLWFQRRAREL
jgi:DNA polymerase-3 subunit epsilon